MMSMITVGLAKIFSAVAKMCVYKMAKTEKEEVKTSVSKLVARAVQHLSFNFITYIAQL